jgi:EmrB/QacA subfamily drug resistance transporter
MIDSKQRNIALLVAACFFMENLDGTIVTTAVPRIGADLHVPVSSVGLIITAYLMTLAVLIPLSGWMVARLGTRKVFLTAIVLFTFASLMCASSVDLGELIAMRVLQGVGGAMMVPVGRLAVVAKTAKTDIMRAMAFIVWPGLVAPVVAPLAGGVITTYTSWRWLFLINIPLGVIALGAAIRLMPAIPPTNPPKLDWAGFILSCLGLSALTWDAHLLSIAEPPWAEVAILAAVSICMLAAAVRHLLRAPAPLVDLRTLQVTSFRKSLEGGSLFGMTVFSVPFLLPLLFEQVFGWSAIRSGAIVLFVFVGNIAIKPTTSYLLNRFGFRTVLITATASMGASLAALGLIRESTPLVVIALIALFSGVARSVGYTGFSTLCFSDIKESDMRHANTLFGRSSQLFGGLGIAAASVALRLGGPLGSLVATHPTKIDTYRVAFFLLAGTVLISTVGAIRMQQGTGDALRTTRADARAKA